MALFKSEPKQTQINPKHTAIISQGVKIKGDLELQAKLHVEGEIDGIINSSNEISIGKDGIIRGELNAKKLIISGKFEGKANADDIEVLKGGILKGDIVISRITIENGGCFAGTSTLKDDKKEIKNPTKKD